MIDSQSDLYRELMHLRSRRGVERPDLASEIGSTIRALSGIQPSDREPAVRQRVETTLRMLIDGLPPDLRSAALLAFALDQDHRYPSLDDRVMELARQSACSPRTARRRMDQALSAMVAGADDVPVEETADGPGWRVTSLKVLFRLDTRTPELYEMRTIVATRDLAEVTLRLSLPPAPDSDVLRFDALLGARVSTVEHRPDRNNYRVVLTLGRTLHAGDAHEFWVRVTLPPHQPTWPHYAIVPLNPCDAGSVRVRFPSARLPSEVWVLDEVPYMDTGSRERGSERLTPDGNGEVARDFYGLREGYGYGMAWTP